MFVILDRLDTDWSQHLREGEEGKESKEWLLFSFIVLPSFPSLVFSSCYSLFRFLCRGHILLGRFTCFHLQSLVFAPRDTLVWNIHELGREKNPGETEKRWYCVRVTYYFSWVLFFLLLHQGFLPSRISLLFFFFLSSSTLKWFVQVKLFLIHLSGASFFLCFLLPQQPKDSLSFRVSIEINPLWC